MDDSRPDRLARLPTGLARVLVLVVCDGAALLASGVVAYLLWAMMVRDQPVSLYLELAPLWPLFTLSYALGGLYPGSGVSAIELIRTASRQTSFVFLIILGSIYVFRMPADYSRLTLALWWGMALVAVPLGRAGLSAVAAPWSWWWEPVILMGDRARLEALIDTLAHARHIGYRPVAVVLIADDGGGPPALWHGVPAVAESDLAADAVRCGVRTVLVSSDVPGLERRAAGLSESVRHVMSVHAIENHFVEPVAIRYLGSSIGIEIQNRMLMRRNQILKRTVDVAVATVCLAISLPVMLLAAMLVVSAERGTWWYAQVREGRGGRHFRMWKLRTMYSDADARLDRHLTTSPSARDQWAREFKLDDDPRVLPGIGAVLRRWSLDECPQFWNVIRGDMSLVGPRALPRYHLDVFEAPFRTLRQRVRPGMTGMWQVMSRGEGAIRTQEVLDSYYIYNWSIWMDAFILARTVLAVIGGRGAR